MRLAGTLACFMVAGYCVEKAVGDIPQIIFSDNLVWLWWVPAVVWFTYAIRISLGGAT